MSEKLYYVAASHTFPNGDKLVHGQQGEVVGPATGENHKGKGLAMLFPGNKDSIDCYLTQLSRDPPVRGPRGVGWKGRGRWGLARRRGARRGGGARRQRRGVGVCANVGGGFARSARGRRWARGRPRRAGACAGGRRHPRARGVSMRA